MNDLCTYYLEVLYNIIKKRYLAYKYLFFCTLNWKTIIYTTRKILHNLIIYYNCVEPSKGGADKIKYKEE